eukprot:gene58299-biopygen105897
MVALAGSVAGHGGTRGRRGFEEEDRKARSAAGRRPATHGLTVGAEVIVSSDFSTPRTADETVLLKKGQKGMVEQVDHQGDALINFEEHEDELRWVLKHNFHNLDVVTRQQRSYGACDPPRKGTSGRSGSWVGDPGW